MEPLGIQLLWHAFSIAFLNQLDAEGIIMLIQIAALALLISALLQSPSLFLASLAGLAGAFCVG